MKIIGLFFLSLFLIQFDAKAVSFSWAVKSDNAFAMCRDAADNIYITGRIPLIKYNASGAEISRINIKKGSGNFTGTAIAADDRGNIFITGSFDQTLGIGNYSVISGGGTDVCLVKIDSTGNVAWIKSGGGSGFEGAGALALDKSNNIYIAGSFQASVGFDGITVNGQGGSNIFLAKYDKNGKIQWVQKGEGKDSNDFLSPGALAIGNNGNCYLTGTVYGSAKFYSISVNAAAQSSEGFIACFNSATSVAWVKQFSNANIRRIKTDQQDNLYITGGFINETDFDQFHLQCPKGGGLFAENIFLAKTDASGKVSWAQRAGGTYSDAASAIATDAAGNIYITGGFSETADFGNSNITSEGEEDIFVAKYDNNGNKLWVTGTGNTGEDGGGAICLNKAENMVYVLGSIQYGPVNFGNIVLNDAGDFGFLTAISDINTGIEMISDQPAFSVYPNPSRGTIHLLFEKTVDPGAVLRIVNISGQPVEVENIREPGKEIVLDHFPAGLYFISLTSRNATHVQKIVVE
jgi:hypothetical protein